jgi:hypothetical protein
MLSNAQWAATVFIAFGAVLVAFGMWNKDTKGAMLIAGVIVIVGAVLFVAAA